MKMEQAQGEKIEADELKGKTLEEFSAIVQKIEETLREKKSVLQPQIKELKDLRKNYEVSFLNS